MPWGFLGNIGAALIGSRSSNRATAASTQLGNQQLAQTDRQFDATHAFNQEQFDYQKGVNTGVWSAAQTKDYVSELFPDASQFELLGSPTGNAGTSLAQGQSAAAGQAIAARTELAKTDIQSKTAIRVAQIQAQAQGAATKASAYSSAAQGITSASNARRAADETRHATDTRYTIDAAKLGLDVKRFNVEVERFKNLETPLNEAQIRNLDATSWAAYVQAKSAEANARTNEFRAQVEQGRLDLDNRKLVAENVKFILGAYYPASAWEKVISSNRFFESEEFRDLVGILVNPELTGQLWQAMADKSVVESGSNSVHSAYAQGASKSRGNPLSKRMVPAGTSGGSTAARVAGTVATVAAALLGLFLAKTPAGAALGHRVYGAAHGVWNRWNHARTMRAYNRSLNR